MSAASDGRRLAPRGGGEEGMADMHMHSLYSDGTSRIADILDHVERNTQLDVIAITDHERIDGALRAREIHRQGDYSFDLVVGEEITTRSGHLLALFLKERIRPLRSLEDTLRAVHDQGGLAIVPHPMSPLTPSIGRRSLARVLRDARPDVAFHAVELLNPSGAGRSRGAQIRALNDELLHLPGVGNSDAHLISVIGSAWTRFPGHTAQHYRAAVLNGEVQAQGEYWTAWQNIDTYRRQLAAKARHLRHTLLPTGSEWR